MASADSQPQTGPRIAPSLDAPSHQPQTNTTKVQQPKPQALPARSGPNSILVSSRQKGNTVLNHIRSFPWEYADIPADYVLGATTCALFLSLKYHRLHPEYIYKRIRDIAGRYNLRVVLTVVDIQNHEEPLRELSKTSLINNVTLILCWSAQEAARYLELYKSCEHAAPTAIRAHQATGYSDKLVEFITTPRSINKTDAVSLISSFGSLRTAINAAPEDVALVPGFGAKKVQRWCNAVREPFRVRKAARRVAARADSLASLVRNDSSSISLSRGATVAEADHDTQDTPTLLDVASAIAESGSDVARPASQPSIPPFKPTTEAVAISRASTNHENSMVDATEAMVMPETITEGAQTAKRKEPELSKGIEAALARLRDQG